MLGMQAVTDICYVGMMEENIGVKRDEDVDFVTT